MDWEKEEKAMIDKIKNIIKDYPEKIRAEKPLIHHITNYVTVNDCANITLAAGASPVMADEPEEAEDIISLSSALVINMGTLNKRTIEAMIIAGKAAKKKNIPVIFDPVGAGASALRNKTAERLLREIKPSVLKGNMSEILFISGISSGAKGVDVSEEDKNINEEIIKEKVMKLALDFECIVAVTGTKDIITDGKNILYVENGHKMMSDITGTGCMSASLTAAYCSVSKNIFLGTAAGILSMGIAGENAFSLAGHKGSGSFRTALIDEIYKTDGNRLLEKAKLYDGQVENLNG
jgi:hydroxyethylthiazole kinase